MHESEMRQLAEFVINLPTPEDALRHAEAKTDILLQGQRVLYDMIVEEKRQHGCSPRYLALVSLMDYGGALRRNCLADSLGQPHLHQPLPTLRVVANTPGQSHAEAVEQAAVAPDGFEQYLSLLRPATGSLQDRLFNISLALAQRRQGTINQRVIDELRELIKDCDRLLAGSAGPTASLKPVDIRDIQASALKNLADVYAAVGDTERSRCGYRQAAANFSALGQTNNALVCETHLAWLDYLHDGDFDTAAAQLRALVNRFPVDSMERVDCQIELGQLYFKADDLYEAQRLLEDAEATLIRLGHPDPSGAEAADTLLASLMNIMSDQPPQPQQQPILEHQRVKGLYHVLFMTLEQIYRQRGNAAKADDYLRRWEALDGKLSDGNENNRQFTDKMLQSLTGLFARYDQFVNGE